jgi:hypothetical protein
MTRAPAASRSLRFRCGPGLLWGEACSACRPAWVPACLGACLVAHRSPPQVLVYGFAPDTMAGTPDDACLLVCTATARPGNMCTYMYMIKATPGPSDRGMHGCNEADGPGLPTYLSCSRSRSRSNNRQGCAASLCGSPLRQEAMPPVPAPAPKLPSPALSHDNRFCPRWLPAGQLPAARQPGLFR